MDLKDKVVLVTGGASGLGYSISKALLKEGAIVHIVNRNIESYYILQYFEYIFWLFWGFREYGWETECQSHI